MLVKGQEVKGTKATIRREFCLSSKPHLGKDLLKSKKPQNPSKVSSLNNSIACVMLGIKYRLKIHGLIAIHSLCFLQEVFTE